MNFGLDVRPSLSRPTGRRHLRAGARRAPPRARPPTTASPTSRPRSRSATRAATGRPNVRLVDRRLPGARPERRLEPPRLAAARPPGRRAARPRALPAPRCSCPRRRGTPHRDAARPLLPQAPRDGRGRDPPRLRDARARARAARRRRHLRLGVHRLRGAAAARRARREDRGHARTASTRSSARRRAPQQVDESLRRLRLPRGGILYVGSDEKRKNLVTLVMAYLTLAAAGAALPPLVLAGPGSRLGAGRQPRRARRSVATGYLERARRARADGRLRRCSCCPRSRRASACRSSRRWPRACPSSARAARRSPRSRATRRSLVDPRDVERRSRTRIERVLDDRALAADLRRRGLERSRAFDWERTAARRSPSTARSLAARPLVVGIDGRELAGRPTGTGRYLRNLLRHWRDGGDDARRLLRRAAARSTRCCEHAAHPQARRSATAARAASSGRSGLLPRAAARRRRRRLLLAGLLLPAARSTGRASRPSTTCRSSPTRRTSRSLDALRRRVARRRRRCAPRARILVCSDFTAREIAPALPRPRRARGPHPARRRRATCPRRRRDAEARRRSASTRAAASSAWARS